MNRFGEVIRRGCGALRFEMWTVVDFVACPRKETHEGMSQY